MAVTWQVLKLQTREGKLQLGFFSWRHFLEMQRQMAGAVRTMLHLGCRWVVYHWHQRAATLEWIKRLGHDASRRFYFQTRKAWFRQWRRVVTTYHAELEEERRVRLHDGHMTVT